MRFNLYSVKEIMTLTLDIKGNFTLQEASEVISEALEYKERVIKYKIKKYSGICKDFEIKYGMGSDFFIEKFEAWDLGTMMTFLTGTPQKEVLISGTKD